MTSDGVIFDLDGTLWDATPALCSAWGLMHQRRPDINVNVTVEKLRDCMGLLIIDIGRRLFPEYGDDFIRPLMAEFCEVQAEYLSEHGGILYPRVQETLAALSEKRKLFVVSNCENGYIEAFLKAHHFEKYFTDFECPGGTGLAKAENISLVARRNGLKAPVYIGDTQGDYDSSRKAGVPFVFAAYGFGHVNEDVPAIQSFSELVELFG